MKTKKPSPKKRVIWLREIARKGGRNGVGACKRRSSEHYTRIAAARKMKTDISVINSVRERWKNRKDTQPPLTLAKLAKELGVSISSVSLIVNNKRRNKI